MEQSEKLKVFNKIQELFISKNKKLDDITAKVWIKNLSINFGSVEIIAGIDKMIWQPDDFPTLAKIAEFIGEERRYISLMNETDQALLESEKVLQIENK